MNRVLIVGGSRPESLEMSYARAFRHLGWEVSTWQPVVALANASRGGKAGRLFGRFVNVEAWLRKSNLELLHLFERDKPDLVLVIGTGYVRAGTLAQAKVLSPGTLLVMLYPDSPHSLDAERIAGLRACDLVTVSSSAWAAPVRKLGAADVRSLPFGADTLFFTGPEGNSAAQAPQWDIGFVGTWRAEREALIERLAGFKTVVWGSDYWKTRTAPAGAARRAWAGREIVGAEIVTACRQCAIMLNILDVTSWPGPNMRSFEVPVSGGFCLSTRTPEILEFFREGETVECFASPEEARDKIAFYLAHPDARRKIAHASHELVARMGHTYVDRTATLARWREELRGNAG